MSSETVTGYRASVLVDEQGRSWAEDLDKEAFRQTYPEEVESVVSMTGGEALRLEELRMFHSRLERAFLDAGLGEHYTISRLKEVWYYAIDKFPDAGRLHKAINKARRLEDYDAAVSALFSSGLYDPTAVFRGR